MLAGGPLQAGGGANVGASREGPSVGAGRGAQVMCPGIPYYPPLMMPPSEVFMLDNGGMVSSGSLDC